MKAQVLKGFRDYDPEEMLVRQRMMDKVREVFESYGYLPLHTPALEYARVLLGKYGMEGEKLLYQFTDHGGREVALRYDLTVPLARYVAMRPNMRFPFRRYQIAPVWRAERPQKGRFREFYQCDVDLVGVDSPAADAECICVDCGVLSALGLEEFRVSVNHRGFLDGLLASLHLPGAAQLPVMRILDKVDKVSRADLEAMLTEEGLSDGQVEVLVGLSEVSGDNARRLERCLELADGHESAAAAVHRLEEVLALVEATLGGAPVVFAPAVARGLDYYTGIVYETFLPAEYGVGSVMSGGRYDELLGSFAGRPIPAVGISLGIDRLLSALASRGSTRAAVPTRALVCLMPGTELEAAGAAAALRRGLPEGANGVELFPRTTKLKKQFDYANKRGVPFVIVVGPDEAARGVATLRSMTSGHQEEVPFQQLARALERLDAGDES